MPIQLSLPAAIILTMIAFQNCSNQNFSNQSSNLDSTSTPTELVSAATPSPSPNSTQPDSCANPGSIQPLGWSEDNLSLTMASGLPFAGASSLVNGSNTLYIRMNSEGAVHGWNLQILVEGTVVSTIVLGRIENHQFTSGALLFERVVTFNYNSATRAIANIVEVSSRLYLCE